ncbi:MAG TPA: DUF2089 domain-containing protein [candidate division Zixibacteria bacterium]|nr:DUF2089 domain-containing protein [candidate division Zixibacteria bacterium]MDD4917940.1 DUF2089 domain-containing protein [candidate division Zixibacteria bacterium]MDM7972508.1 DUF2089 domain-containing protein [candidate division Zixibacteria bacterium]HOD65237.1 DUF2089 domain-containing protein [candidate division Zixibacteria bacterium]HPC10638.1 DUF2089 domain-containing protein [candidate division Zixibacteria bacterium]
MAHEWQELTRLTGDKEVIVERVRLVVEGIALEGEFELPPLAKLTAEDQLFVAAFVRSHGSIKKMEEVFGISYPTVKNRLNRIGAALSFAQVQVEPGDRREELLDRLERGEITVQDALSQLEKEQNHE